MYTWLERDNFMSAQLKPLAEVSQQANHALVQAIGVTDTLRFLGQFSAGTGNYTQERQSAFTEQSTQDIIADIKAQRHTNH